MKRFPRGLVAAFGGLTLLAVIGCAEDNEKGAQITSTPPAAGAGAAPRTQEEYFKKNPGSQGTGAYKGQGYPGAK